MELLYQLKLTRFHKDIFWPLFRHFSVKSFPFGLGKTVGHPTIAGDGRERIREIVIARIGKDEDLWPRIFKRYCPSFVGYPLVGIYFTAQPQPCTPSRHDLHLVKRSDPVAQPSGGWDEHKHRY